MFEPYAQRFPSRVRAKVKFDAIACWVRKKDLNLLCSRNGRNLVLDATPVEIIFKLRTARAAESCMIERS